jgi:hypothetical protein
VPATYEPIATTTLSSTASSITFSSISSAYTDLRLVWCGKAASGLEMTFGLTYNGDTATNYSYTIIYGTGVSALSYRASSTTKISATDSGNIKPNGGLITFDIESYAGSTFKTSLHSTSNDNNGSGFLEQGVGLWRSTSAITSITITSNNAMAIGTTATLYGIKSF